MKAELGVIKGYKELNIPFTYVRNERYSKNLVVFLPGTGYTVQSPLFHYAKELFIQRDFDVLQVKYQYKDKAYADFTVEEKIDAILFDVNKVMDQVLNTAPHYKNYYIMGKSMGTIAMKSVLDRAEFIEAKAIWLTPLLQLDEVFAAIVTNGHKGLCFIGDQDDCYIKERYNVLKANPNIVSRLIPNVNHSLEYEDFTVDSMDVLKSVILDIQKFVEQG